MWKIYCKLTEIQYIEQKLQVCKSNWVTQNSVYKQNKRELSTPSTVYTSYKNQLILTYKL